MKLKIFGAAKEVTGSCYSLETKNEKILIDCGFFQGGKENERRNYQEFPFNPSEYSAIILTHAHLDHCGRIPKLVKEGFKGKIFSTDATQELANIIMMDTVKISIQDTEHENRRRIKQGLPPRKPIYSSIDVKRTMNLFINTEYEKKIKITKNISAIFFDAGHILGAACVKIIAEEDGETKQIIFSGDIGQSSSVLVREARQLRQADYIVIESTYGDRLHPPIENRTDEFLRIIKETHKKKGKLLIPSFAVERAQELLYCLGDFFQEGMIPKMKVFLDSPMAMEATKVFAKYNHYYNKDVQREIEQREKIPGRKEIFNFPELTFTRTAQESKKINNIKEPCIIIAGNGMCTAGRIKHHIRNNIENPKNTLLFVGYQARGTLGYWIKAKEKKVKLLGVQVKVRSNIEAIDGFSAHADYIELIDWLKNLKEPPKKIIITHGEEMQSKAFQKRLNKIGYNAHVPELYEEIELD